MFSSIVNWVGDKLYMFMPAAPGAVGITPELLEQTRKNLKHVDTKVKGIKTDIFEEENCCKKCDLIMKDLDVDIETITEDLCSGDQDDVYKCENGVCMLKDESEDEIESEDVSNNETDNTSEDDSDNTSEDDSDNTSEFDSDNTSEFDSDNTSENDSDSFDEDENVILKRDYLHLDI